MIDPKDMTEYERGLRDALKTVKKEYDHAYKLSQKAPDDPYWMGARGALAKSKHMIEAMCSEDTTP